MTESDADRDSMQMIRDYLKAKSTLACLTNRIQKQSAAVEQAGSNMRLAGDDLYHSLLNAWDEVGWESLGRDMELLRSQVAEKERLEALLRNSEFAGLIDK